MKRFQLERGEVILLGTVQGLVAEKDRVLDVLANAAPDIVALGVSPESVASLLRYVPDPDLDLIEELPDHDYIYSVKLGEFGEVALPAPDLLAAIHWAQDRAIPVFGVDLAEEAYEDLFTKEVSAWGFLRYGRIQRKIAKRPPRANDPLAFTLAWDAAIRRVKGIDRIENRREETMALTASRLAREKPAKVLLLVEAAREAGVARRLALEQ